MATTTLLRSTLEVNKTLRNTFILLAITLIPTVIGTWAGLEFGLPELFKHSPWMSFAGFLATIAVLLFSVYHFARSAVAIPLVLLLSGVMGASLSSLINTVFKTPHGVAMVSLAGVGTIITLVCCSIYALTTKRDFSGMKGLLLGSLLGLVALTIIGSMLAVPMLTLILALLSFLLFSVFLVYDVQQIVNGGQDNYILATVQIYLDTFNIFSSLLQMGASVADEAS